MAINETKEKVVEEIPEVVEAEPLTQKEIETITVFCSMLMTVKE